MQFRPKKIDYTSPAGASGGPGIAKQITWYQGTPYVNMTSAVYTGVQQAIGASLGDVWWLGGGAAASGGNAFMFVKAKAALSLGQLVTMDDPTATTASGAGDASLSFIKTAYNNSGGTVNNDVGNWIHVDATGASLPQFRLIKANDAAATASYTVALKDYMRPNLPYDQDVFDTAATNADVVNIIRPYNVKVCTATTVPVGVALGTVTSGNYTIVQVAGIAILSAAGSGGSYVAIAVNKPASPAAAGVVTGFAGTATALTGAAGNLYSGAGSIIPLIANTSGSALLQPFYINFTGV
jgi:hypothetical protein